MYEETKTPKNFLIFKETETLKKFYILENGNFQPKLEKIKQNPPQENIIIYKKTSGNGHPEKILIFS